MTGKETAQTTQDQQAQQPPQPAKQQTVEPIDTPAPRYEAGASITWYQQRQLQQAKDKVDPGVPDSARPIAATDAKWVLLPAGGIAALADSLFPADKGDAEAMHQHVFDLMMMNRDVVRDDTSSTVGTMVRIP
jgi:hypothetical protein